MDKAEEPVLDAQATIEDYILHSETLAEQAETILKNNDRGNYTVPADSLYPHQWLWDSCFIAIGQRHYDVERAKMELLSLLRGQWRNGMLPNIIFNDASNYKRDRDIWRSWVSPFSPDGVATSGITQPPMLAEAVVQVGAKMKAAERRTWYKTMWPALLAYHEWLYIDRDPHGEGLVLQIHPWETGMDNTPPWMAELHGHLLPFWIRGLEFTKLEKIVGMFRRDTRRVPADQRFSNIEVLALFDAQLRLRRKSYDIAKILDHGLFAVEDLAFNCILIRANEHLVEISKTIRTEIPKVLLESMELATKRLEELWDPYAQEYFSRDFITHKLMKVSSIAALMPLYAGCISKERAEALVRKMENDHLFGPAYPVPSVPVSSEWFDADRYWQGPSWVNTNWLIIEGLNRYGFRDHAAALRETTLEMVTKGGFYEYFHPLTGQPLGI